ncbi:DHHA1 domain-containing protein [Stenotrophomonas sp. NPDC101269]|uniref:DHHA1 domain-containing protein n=1 Tax=Stenotrophomonas TaxID=40323 RepID=UPI0002D733BC
MKPLVIYHANCADGFTAAWAVRQAMDAEFHPGVYGEAPPEVAGRDVILVDFCYPFDVLMQLGLSARSVLVLDHHKSAEASLTSGNCYVGQAGLARVVRLDSLPDARAAWDYYSANASVGSGIVCALFDMSRSGAGIAWDFFHPAKARPAFLDHVEDRDLWRFALQHTREICATVHSHPYTFQAWDALAAETTYSLYQQGLVLERARAKDVAEQVALSRRELVIGNYRVPAASIPRALVSEAGHLMGKGRPFAACYYDTASGRVFSLRSTPDAVDVSEVAALYGGGGHARAAGFTVPRDHELARA